MSDLGLNPYLQANSSPLVKRNNVTGYDFFNRYERGLISQSFMGSASIGHAQLGTAIVGTANIGTLSFNEISGGTATLGGAANGDGLLVVNDASGTEISRLDNTGLTVKRNGTPAIFIGVS